MKAEKKKEINIQIGKRLQTARENEWIYAGSFCRDAGCRGRALSQNRKWCLWLTGRKMLILYEVPR